MPTPRDLQFGSQYSDQNFQQPETISGTTPSQKFSGLLTQLLQRHQKLGTRPFAEQSLNAQQEQVNRTEQTPANMIGASPTAQSSVRANMVSAVQPTVSGANQGMQTFGEQIKSFGDVITNTRQFLKDEEDRQQQLKDNMRQNIIDAATLGGSAGLDSLLKTEEGKQAFKLAGFDADTLIASVKAQEDVKKKREKLEQDQIQVNMDKVRYDMTPKKPGEDLSYLAQAVVSGNVSLEQLTPSQRGEVAAELQKAGVTSPRQAGLESNLGLVEELLNNPNLGRISGFFQGKLRFGDADPRAQLALNQFNQLKGILSLENREKLKGSGAISDFEFRVLGEAATALGRNLNDSDFKAQLEKVKEVFAGKYANTRASGKNGGGGNTTRLLGPDGKQYDVPNDRVDDFLKAGGKRTSFNSGTTSSAVNANKLAEAIIMHESGGRAQPGKSGEYGLAQFLPATWRTISSSYNKAVNRVAKPLVQNTRNEVAVVKWKVADLLNRGYSPREVAMIWNGSLGGSEKPIAKRGRNSSGQAYDTVAYANKVLAVLNKLS